MIDLMFLYLFQKVDILVIEKQILVIYFFFSTGTAITI